MRSFADSDGDGIGDLPGLRSRLDHVARLGVDAIWLNPFYASPQVDGGYDVADHRAVDPLFGTLDDLDALVADAHRLGLRVVLDLVANHTSSAHPWFEEAIAAVPGSAERARYHFLRGRGALGGDPPNDWQSVFGGPAWSRVDDGQWYLHLFAPEQPDLNWDNQEVWSEVESVIRFWLDRGVDGFRIDVAHGLIKDPSEDIAGRFLADGPASPGHPHWDREGVHDVYRRWRRVVAESRGEGDVALFGEAWVETPQQLARYLRPGELHAAFAFDLLLAPWDARRIRAAIESTLSALSAVGAPPTWVLSNHDVVRHATRYGGGANGLRRARAAVVLVLALPGKVFMYQGEELGLPEVTDLPDDARQDPTFVRTGGADAGRDGCRVPIPWSGTEPPFGFSSPEGLAADPWLPQPPAWAEWTVERQAGDPESTLSLYQAAIQARRQHLVVGSSVEWIEPEGSGEEVLAFGRGGSFVCVVNVGDKPIRVPSAVVDRSTVLLASAPMEADGRIPGATAVWYCES